MILLLLETMLDTSESDRTSHSLHLVSEIAASDLFSWFAAMEGQFHKFDSDNSFLHFTLRTDLCAFERVVGAMHLEADISFLYMHSVLFDSMIDRTSLLLLLCSDLLA